MTVAPADVDESPKRLHICYDPIIKEPECLSFEVFHNAEEPGVFRILELWSRDREGVMAVCFSSLSTCPVSNDGFQVQAKKPYYDPYHEAVTKLWIIPSKLRRRSPSSRASLADSTGNLNTDAGHRHDGIL
jgi:hypothetical protein